MQEHVSTYLIRCTYVKGFAYLFTLVCPEKLRGPFICKCNGNHAGMILAS